MFLELPFIVSIIILTVVCVGAYLIADLLTRKRIQHDLLTENHAVSGFIYNAVCVVYAVLIAFVVFVIWSKLEVTNSKIEGEANNLLNLYYDASAFPDTTKKDIQGTIREYVKRVTNEEWKALSYGGRDDEAAKLFVKLNRIYMSVNSNMVANPEVISQSMSNMKDLREYRRHRLLSSKQNMPAILWVVLILSAVILVVFTFLFSVRSVWQNNVMTAFLIFANVLILYLVYVLDNPFVGHDAIKPEAFQPLIDMVNRTVK